MLTAYERDVLLKLNRFLLIGQLNCSIRLVKNIIYIRNSINFLIPSLIASTPYHSHLTF